MSTEIKLCEWDHQDHYGYYSTQCNNAFEFTHDGVAENDFKFCPFCGGEIQLTRLEPKEEK